MQFACVASRECEHKTRGAGEALNGDTSYVAQFQVASAAPSACLPCCAFFSSARSGTAERNAILPAFLCAARLFHGPHLPAEHVPHQLPPQPRQRAVPQAFQRRFFACIFCRQVCSSRVIRATRHATCDQTNSSPRSHDNSRFLNKQTNQQLYRNALSMVVFGVGIPMCVFPPVLS